MGFLKRSFAFFRKWFRQEPQSAFAGEVEPDEPIARFVCDHHKLYFACDRVKPGAYLPKDGKTSVYRVRGLDTDGVRRLGTDVLRRPPPLAHATCLGATVCSCPLRFDPDNTPERHANIVGWPERKDEQKLLALKLAKAATVFRYT